MPTVSSRPASRRAASLAVALGLLFGSSGGVSLAASVPVGSKPLTTYRTCVLTANPAASTAAIDSYVDQNNATSNFGTANTLSVQSRNVSRNRRPFVDFDLTKCSPAIPSSATVTNGTLRLYVTAVPNACETEDAYRVTGSQWSETGITWNNAPATAAAATASITMGTPCGIMAPNQYASWDVTADTRLFAAGTANFGWMVRDRIEDQGGTRTATFSSKNLGTLAQAPQLIVTYST